MDRKFCNKISEVSGLKRTILNKLITKWYLITYKKSKKVKDNFQKNFKSLGTVNKIYKMLKMKNKKKILKIIKFNCKSSQNPKFNNKSISLEIKMTIYKTRKKTMTRCLISKILNNLLKIKFKKFKIKNYNFKKSWNWLNKILK
jgi:hypothetical protein